MNENNDFKRVLDLSGPSDTPLILVTNDDGISSPGLLATVEVARLLGDVLVAAPTTQQTAMGRSMTGDKEDFFHQLDLELAPCAEAYAVGAYHINASPAMAVRHALAVLCPARLPSMVLSGINYGENLGNNITMSGTVGAAFQAAAHGIPAIAVSRQTSISNHFAHAELEWEEPRRVLLEWATQVLDLIKSVGRRSKAGGGAPYDLRAILGCELLKIDIPEPCPPGTEERITSLSQTPYFLSRITTPRPDTPISAAETYILEDRSLLAPDDDIYAVLVDKVVSVTPLQLSNGVSVHEFRQRFKLADSESPIEK